MDFIIVIISFMNNYAYSRGVWNQKEEVEYAYSKYYSWVDKN